MKVLVIGGGVTGITTAYYLARDGHQVTLLERGAALAGDCSYANGGMLHVSHTEPWNSPDVFRQMARWLGRENAPLRLRPSQLPKLIGWGLGFLRYSQPHHHRRSLRLNTALALYSRQQLKELRAATGIRYDDCQQGIVKIFRDRQVLEKARRVSAELEAMGLCHQTLSITRLIELEPALADVRHALAGGIYYPDDEAGDCHLFCQRLGALAVKLGVDLRLSEQVIALTRSAEGIASVRTDRAVLTADRYVLAAGVDSPLLSRQLGLKLPIRPVKGYSATLPAAGLPGVPRIPIIDEEHKIVITRLGDQLRLAGTAEFAGHDRSIPSARVQAMLRQGLTNLPRYAAAVDSASAGSWACLRPMTMDGPPILGASALPNLFLNTGAGHLGWTFAAGSARAVADLVGERRPQLDLAPYSYARFDRRRLASG